MSFNRDNSTESSKNEASHVPSISASSASSTTAEDLGENEASAIPSLLNPKKSCLSSLPIELMSHIFSYFKRHLPLRLVCRYFDASIQHLHQTPEFDCKMCHCTSDLVQMLVKRIRLPWLTHWSIKGDMRFDVESSHFSFASHLMELDDKALAEAIPALRRSIIKDLDICIGEENIEDDMEFLLSEHFSSVQSCSLRSTSDDVIECFEFHSCLAAMTQLKSFSVKDVTGFGGRNSHLVSCLASLSNLQSLDLTNCCIDDPCLYSMAKMPSLVNLTSLVLSNNYMRDRKVLKPFLRAVPKLKHLDLSGNYALQPKYLLPIFKSAAMCHLESLDIRDYCVDDEELLALRTSRYMSRLKKLVTNENSCSPRSVLALFLSLSPDSATSSPLARSLQDLTIDFLDVPTFAADFKRLFTEICTAEARATLKPSRLRRLSIEFGLTTNDAVAVLASLPVLSGLRHLAISDVGEDGLTTLFNPATSCIRNLTTLKIISSPVPFTWKELKIISSSPLANELRALRVGYYVGFTEELPENHLDDKWAETFTSAPSFLSNLRILRIARHRMSLSAGLLSILSGLRTCFPHLHYLDMAPADCDTGELITVEDAPADREASAEDTAAKIVQCLQTSASNLENLLLPEGQFPDRVRSLLSSQVRPGFLSEKIELPL